MALNPNSLERLVPEQLSADDTTGLEALRIGLDDGTPPVPFCDGLQPVALRFRRLSDRGIQLLLPAQDLLLLHLDLLLAFDYVDLHLFQPDILFSLGLLKRVG